MQTRRINHFSPADTRIAVATPLPSVITLHEADSGIAVAVKAGGTAIVSLPEDITTVNKWIIDSQGANIILHDESKKTEGNIQLRVFRFVVNAGNTVLSFKLQNPWAKDVTPLATVSYDIEAS